jgi:nicotinate-nucleotide adenylyltransferase
VPDSDGELTRRGDSAAERHETALGSAASLARHPGPVRVGLFGGTFDPPHVGHLVTAVNVAHELQLDVVVLMVNNVAWQKEGIREITPAEDRYALVAAAVSTVDRLQPGRHEIELGGNSYTADTLRVLRDEYPEAEFFTIIGDDAAAGLHTWERYEEVVAQSRLVVVDRPGEPVELPDDVDWIRVEVPRLEVSSTDLRRRFTDGRPLDYLVTNPVLRVIAERGLYGVARGQDVRDRAGETVGVDVRVGGGSA